MFRKEEPPYPLKRYSKARVSEFCEISRTTLIADIKRCKILKAQLVLLGYKKNDKYFSSKQVRILFDYYGVQYYLFAIR